MVFLRRWLLVLSLLIMSGGQIFAASREERAFAAAVADFEGQLWNRAEAGLMQFLQRFPRSTNAPLAVLLTAQAQIKQARFTAAITLLEGRRAQAGALADQYGNWIGEAHFSNGNFPAAAAAFESLAKDFPESPLRLRAAVSAAAAHEKMADWKKLSALLGDTNGVFAKKAELDAANELVVRGRMMLAQANYEQGNYAAAAAQLAVVNPQLLEPALDWQRAFLLCRARMAAREWDLAFAAATNLAAIAQVEKNEIHRAEGAALRAEILEKQGRLAEALTVWRENLAASVPEEKQRQAILKLAALAVELGQFAEAQNALTDFSKRFPGAAANDLALLALGELYLKRFALAGGAEDLVQAQKQFDLLLTNFPTSALAGKAWLGRGWALSLPNRPGAGLEAFQRAVESGLSAADRVVAQFKAGDAFFARNDFAAALREYAAVLSASDGAAKELAGLALYQSLRAHLELGDMVAAGWVFERLFLDFSDGALGQGSALLYGESLVQPAEARALFERLAPKFAGSAAEAQLRLALGRTFEQQQNWPAAVTNYAAWLKDFATNALRPEAEYALAQAQFHAGDSAAAQVGFGRFVHEHPEHALAPVAQWWVAEQNFRSGEYIAAETNYEAIFQSPLPVWKASPLVYPAQLMAGRAALGRLGYKDAVGYFNALISDTNCPDELGIQARFAGAAALMQMQSADTNSTAANLQSATNLFYQVILKNPTNEFAARARGETADCAALLGDFATATNAYAQVFSMNSPANVPLRSRAQVGLALVLEKMSRLNGAETRTNRLQLALDNYLQVFRGTNLREGEEPDVFWQQKAGLQAATLVGELYDPARQRIFYAQLEKALPQLAPAIARKLAALPAPKE